MDAMEYLQNIPKVLDELTCCRPQSQEITKVTSFNNLLRQMSCRSMLQERRGEPTDQPSLLSCSHAVEGDQVFNALHSQLWNNPQHKVFEHWSFRSHHHFPDFANFCIYPFYFYHCELTALLYNLFNLCQYCLSLSVI